MQKGIKCKQVQDEESRWRMSSTEGDRDPLGMFTVRGFHYSHKCWGTNKPAEPNAKSITGSLWAQPNKSTQCKNLKKEHNHSVGS